MQDIFAVQDEIALDPTLSESQTSLGMIQLMEMNFLDWLVVNATFSLSQPGENQCRPVPNTPAQPRIVNNLENVAEVPVRVLGRCLDPSVSRADSRAMNLLEIYLPTRDPEQLQLFNQRARFEADVDQCAENHVTAGAGEAVEVKCFHNIVVRSRY